MKHVFWGVIALFAVMAAFILLGGIGPAEFAIALLTGVAAGIISRKVALRKRIAQN